MTDQQPHTPYIEDGWLVAPCEPDYAPGIGQEIPGSWSEPIVNLTELDGYDELIAAAEQRGAERALRIASRDITLDNGFIEKIAKEYLEWAADRIEDGDIDIAKNDRTDQMEGGE